MEDIVLSVSGRKKAVETIDTGFLLRDADIGLATSDLLDRVNNMVAT